MEVLKVEDLTKDFGGVRAVSNVSFTVERGERLAIIGPNGAGKTTLFNVLTGQLKPTGGTICYLGKDITHLAPHNRIHLGIGRSFQITSLFGELSVLDNMLLAVEGTRRGRYSMTRFLKGNKPVMNKASELLHSFNLWELRDEKVSCIAYGEQRRLEIALSMAADPTLLLLDEPSCGLTTVESAELSTRIGNLSKEIALICVAHDMDLVFGIASRIMLMHYGEVILDDKPEQIKSNPVVKEIYMGTKKKL